MQELSATLDFADETGFRFRAGEATFEGSCSPGPNNSWYGRIRRIRGHTPEFVEGMQVVISTTDDHTTIQAT